MCWHNWSKWGTPFQDVLMSTYQFRQCRKCEKIDIRQVTGITFKYKPDVHDIFTGVEVPTKGTFDYGKWLKKFVK